MGTCMEEKYDRTDDQTYDNYGNRDKTYKMLQFI